VNDVSYKITLFSTSFRGGGAEKAMVQLANGLALCEPFSVELLVADSSGPNKALVSTEVELIDLKKRSVSRSLPSLVRYFQIDKPDAVLTTGLHACIIVSIAHWLAKSKAKLIAREALPLSVVLSLRPHLKLFTRWFYPRFHAMVGLTECQANDRCKVVKPKLTTKQVVIPNAVDWNNLARLVDGACVPKIPKTIEQRPFIIAMGRLNPQKNFELLLKAFDIAVKDLPHALIILGEGPYRDPLEALAKELAIDERVWFAGYADNPYPFLKKSDLFVLSSNFEGMPNALVDAIAIGKPVVSTDCQCGPSELIRDTDRSTLVPVDDIPAMACAIREQISHTEAHGNSVRVNVTETWKKRYSSNEVVRQYFDLIKELVVEVPERSA